MDITCDSHAHSWHTFDYLCGIQLVMSGLHLKLCLETLVEDGSTHPAVGQQFPGPQSPSSHELTPSAWLQPEYQYTLQEDPCPAEEVLLASALKQVLSFATCAVNM